MFRAVEHGRELMGSVPKRLPVGRSIALDAFRAVLHKRLGAMFFCHEPKVAAVIGAVGLQQGQRKRPGQYPICRSSRAK
jgi:hypothetical protein